MVTRCGRPLARLSAVEREDQTLRARNAKATLRPQAASGSDSRPPKRAVLLYVAAATLVLTALYAFFGLAYLDYSEGVYAYTARAVGQGAALYSQIAAAQPPPLFLSGAALLWLGDSMWVIRGGLAVVSLASGTLVLIAVWRLTQSSLAAVIGALASLLTPWALREHAVLTPETFAGPLLLLAALLASRPRSSVLGGAAAATAVAFKVAYALPALALVVAASDRRRYVVGSLLTCVLLWSAFVALYGGALVENVLVAQRQTGGQGVSALVGLLAQAAWNLAPLLILASLAWLGRPQARDSALLESLLVLLVAETLLLGTLLKDGSYLNFLSVIELPAVTVGSGGVLWLSKRRSGRASGVRSGGAVTAATVICVALAMGQAGSLLLDPMRPGVFVRPLSRPAHGVLLSHAEVMARARVARRCPPGLPYSGEPYVAFIARRSMPGDQPDQFIVSQARTHVRFRAAAAAAGERCP